MTPQNKLYEAAKEVLYGWAIRLTRPRSEWNKKLQTLADAISAYEQSIEQPEAIAGENDITSLVDETFKGLAELINDDDLFAFYKQLIVTLYEDYTSAKDKEIAELKVALSELIQVKDYKDKYGKDEHYLKAMPIAWENVRKLIQK